MKEKKTLNVLCTDDDHDDRFFFQKALDAEEFPSYLKTVRDGEHLMSYLYEFDARPRSFVFRFEYAKNKWFGISTED